MIFRRRTPVSWRQQWKGDVEIFIRSWWVLWDEHAAIAAILNGDLESLKYLLHAHADADGDVLYTDWSDLSDLEGVFMKLLISIEMGHR